MALNNVRVLYPVIRRRRVPTAVIENYVYGERDAQAARDEAERQEKQQPPAVQAAEPASPVVQAEPPAVQAEDPGPRDPVPLVAPVTATAPDPAQTRPWRPRRRAQS